MWKKIKPFIVEKKSEYKITFAVSIPIKSSLAERVRKYQPWCNSNKMNQIKL